MLFIKNGVHMVALKEGSILKIRKNTKFVRDGISYGSVMLNDNVIGVYPLTAKNEYTKTLYQVWDEIAKNIEKGYRIIELPAGYDFKSMEEWNEYNDLSKMYNENELFNNFHDSLKETGLV